MLFSDKAAQQTCKLAFKIAKSSSVSPPSFTASLILSLSLSLGSQNFIKYTPR